MTAIADNLKTIHEKIDAAAGKAGRSGSDIKLICVSKTVPAERVMEAYDSGERAFGENRVQEYLEKSEKMPKDIDWHIIGRLQTNKVKYIINNVCMLHSLDRLNLASELQKELVKKDAYLDVLIQINTAEEETKAGFLPAEIFRAADEIAGLDRLKVKGIMTVAPFTDDTDYLKQVFSETYSVFEKLRDGNYGEFDIKWLSMGMSGDYELAIEYGANMVRIGSSIFGMRSYL